MRSRFVIGGDAMLEIMWQYDPTQPRSAVRPGTAAEACTWLEQGNRELMAFIETYVRSDGRTAMRHVTRIVPDDLGVAATPGQLPSQEPFAAILSCADARVPTEML